MARTSSVSSPPSLQGRVCVVTGANSGIGRAAAQQLAAREAAVVLVCRNRERGEAAQRAIRAATGNAAVSLKLADLSDQQALRRLADDLMQTHGRLDVLINNAGGYFSSRGESADGVEMTWALNHLAPFLLTNLLREALAATPDARVVTVSSEAHTGGTMRFDDLEFAQRRYNGLAAYAQSKLANVLFTYELARRWAATGVTATCLHPGVVATNIWTSNAGWLGWLVRPFRWLMMTPEKSGRAVMHLAVDVVAEAAQGTYFKVQKPARSAPITYDEDVAERLWHVSAQQTGWRVDA